MTQEQKRERWRIYMKEYRKQKLVKLTNAPLCFSCHHVPHQKDRFLCVACQAAKAASSTKAKQSAWKRLQAVGLCVSCHKPNTTGFPRCALCRKKHCESVKKYQRKKRLRAKTEGLCFECGGQLDRAGFYCTECLIHHRVRRYKGYLTIEKFKLLSKVCEICGTSRKVYIDHDHTTGAVRGMLCQDCNMAIGQLKDLPELAAAAAVYLERVKGISPKLIGACG